MRPAEVETPTKNLTHAGYTYPLGCDHIITTYVVPNFLHFVAFLMGIIHFRVQENEQLYALMENVSTRFPFKTEYLMFFHTYVLGVSVNGSACKCTREKNIVFVLQNLVS